MTTTVERIVAHVAANPGVRYADLCAAVGITSSCGFVAYARRRGLIFAAGPRSWQRYFPTAAEAAVADQMVRDMVLQHERARKAREAQEHNRRRKAASRLLGKSRNTRPNQAVHGEPAARSFVVDGRRFVVAAPPAEAKPPRAVSSAEARAWAVAVAQQREAA
jgi:hypothetical protein